MKTVTHEEQITLDGVCLPINTTKSSGCYVEILEACKGQLDAMGAWHSRLFVYRFDLRLKEYTEDNKIMSDFIRAVRKMVKRKYPISRMGFLWGREQASAAGQHYHVALILDGNKIHHPAKLQVHLTEQAAKLGMSLGHCPRPFHCIRRANLTEYEKCFYRLSYIAKEHSKGGRKPTVNDYSTSRIKPPAIALAA
ncbi:inovirus-type Gp2 protein [Marinobacter sp. W-8]|uniref:YagK/YfjJ domain-containing protein n=1 Tax=Marinobacter sp. W-8 TaxID=3369658 RepID=UPI0037CBE81A